jgi:hypothetical protein
MTRDNFGYGLIGVSIFASYSYFFITIVFGLFIFFNYAIAGFLGISLCALGLVSNIIHLNIIDMFSNAVYDHKYDGRDLQRRV